MLVSEGCAKTNKGALFNGSVAESVDALDLGSSVFGREGSSPSGPTNFNIYLKMKRLIFILMATICSIGMFGRSVTISEEHLKSLPEETQKYIMDNSMDKDTEKSASIGTEIGIAVNETFKAISDNTTKLAESNLGKTAIFMLSWKILYKDVIGLIVGIFLLVTTAVIVSKVLNQLRTAEEKHDGEVSDVCGARVIIGCIASILFFISSMCCIF